MGKMENMPVKMNKDVNISGLMPGKIVQIFFRHLQHLQACFFYVYSAESKMGSLIPQCLLFVH